MKTSKKLLSVLLAALLLASICFTAFADSYIADVTASCPMPEAGDAFLTAEDFEIDSKAVITGVRVEEVQGDTAVPATPPFEDGKTYNIIVSIETANSQDEFADDLTMDINDINCYIINQTERTADVVLNVTIGERFDVTVRVVPEGAGTVYGAGSYPRGKYITLIQDPTPGFMYAYYSYNGNICNNFWSISPNYALNHYEVTEDIDVTVKYVPEEAGIQLPMNTEGLKNGDWYLDVYQFTAFWAEMAPNPDSEEFQYYVDYVKSNKTVTFYPNSGLVFVDTYEHGFFEYRSAYLPEMDDYGALRYSIRQYQTSDQPEPPTAPVCKWCGGDHSNGFFQKIIGFFHNILASIFGAKY